MPVNHEELYDLGMLACEFPESSVGEILLKNWGDVNEAANAIIMMMNDECLEEEALDKLDSFTKMIWAKSMCDSNKSHTNLMRKQK